jgi:hypothetical protein
MSFFFQDDSTKKALYRYKEGDPKKDLSKELPDIAAKMNELTQGIYETARYMLYHNPKFQKQSQSVSVK